MKTQKIAALALLAAFAMIASVTTPLVDDGGSSTTTMLGENNVDMQASYAIMGNDYYVDVLLNGISPLYGSVILNFVISQNGNVIKSVSGIPAINSFSVKLDSRLAAGTYDISVYSTDKNNFIAVESQIIISDTTYTVTVTSNTGGKVTPTMTVSKGGDAIIIATPNDGYDIESVTLDGEVFNPSSVSPDGKSLVYVISDIQSNHVVNVIFKLGEGSKFYTIYAEAEAGGSIKPSGETLFKSGTDAEYTIICNSGYKVDKVLVDNKEVSLTDGKYTFSNVNKDHKISVTFKKSDSGGGSGGGGVITTNYTITATAGSGGKINPSGNVSVKAGDSKTFTITCDSGYEVDKVLVDNKEASLTDGKYTFSNITENHSIKVTFKESGTVPQKLIIEAEAGKGGSISPERKVEVTAGGNQTFTITPDSGYEVDKVLVDNKEASLTDGKYTFSNITENHSIKVTFKESGETPTPSGDNGKNNTMYYIIAAIIAILIIIAIVYFFMKK